MADEGLCLEDIDGGALLEEVNAAIQAVAANALDPNTKATAKRKITLTIEVTPDETRAAAIVDAKVDKKLAGPRARRVMAYLGEVGGEAVLAEKDVRQQSMSFDRRDVADSAGGRVHPLKGH